MYLQYDHNPYLVKLLEFQHVFDWVPWEHDNAWHVLTTI
jgi:hypothetical protein